MLYYKTYTKDPLAEWIVFIHGAGGSSNLWFKQIREFRRYFNILTVDLRGHGKSQNLPAKKQLKRYTFKEVSKDVIEVLDHLKIESAHFIGLSLGTIIVRCIAELAENRVKSMILGGAITKLTLQPRLYLFMTHLVKHIFPFMLIYKICAFAIMPKKKHKISRLLFIREAKSIKKKEFLRWFHLTWNINDLLRLFAERKTKSPILYIMGSEDYMFLPPVKKIVQNHDNCYLKIIEDAGHVCNLEKHNEFNQYCIEFIQNHT